MGNNSSSTRSTIVPIFDIKNKIPQIQQDRLGYVIPNSPTTHALKSIFETAGTKQELKASKNINMETKRDLYGNATYNYESTSNTFEISIADYKKVLTRQDVMTRKIFNFILEKYNQQKDDTIHFTLDEIVERGLYKNKDTARRGVDRAIAKLMLIHVKGTTTKGKKTTSISRCQLIMESKVANSSYIKVKPSLYNYLSQYYTMLPTWGDQLKGKAYSILDYIYYRARQEMKNIKEKNSFNISLRTLNDHLAQPSPEDTRRHTEYIIDPILEAIEEIEMVQAQHKEASNEMMSLQIQPVYPDNYSNANDFLNGYLIISLDDKTEGYLIDLEDKFNKKKQANINRIKALKEAPKKEE